MRSADEGRKLGVDSFVRPQLLIARIQEEENLSSFFISEPPRPITRRQERTIDVQLKSIGSQGVVKEVEGSAMPWDGCLFVRRQAERIPLCSVISAPST
jgi:hypothetical protein